MTDDLRRATDTVRAFIQDEAAARRALYLEADDARYAAALGRAEAHIHDSPDAPVPLGFGRPPGSGALATDDVTRESAERLEPRVLFAVARHERDGAPVYRAYTADPADAAGVMFGMTWNLAEVDQAIKVVGKTGSSPFGPPGELTWEPLGGDQLDGAGPALEAVRLQRPQAEPFAAHYDALPGGQR
jgi:hypothetical protein